MKASFIVPLFNRLDLTRAMLESLVRSLPAGLAHEIILVDDASTDGTRDWVAGLPPPVRPLLLPHNGGYARANNAGAALATGEVLVLLNNDLILPPGWLEPMLEALDALGAQAGVIGNLQERVDDGLLDHAGIAFDAKGKPAHLRSEPSVWERLALSRRVCAAVTGACIAVRTDLWREVGGLDPAYVNGCEDVDLCLKVRALGKVNAVALRSRVRHHVSASPGRKLRDEANTFRLVSRWRNEIAALAARAWAVHRFEDGLADPRRFRSDREAWVLAAFRTGLLPTPPDGARLGIQAAIDRELARWRELGVASAER